MVFGFGDLTIFILFSEVFFSVYLFVTFCLLSHFMFAISIYDICFALFLLPLFCFSSPLPLLTALAFLFLEKRHTKKCYVSYTDTSILRCLAIFASDKWINFFPILISFIHQKLKCDRKWTENFVKPPNKTEKRIVKICVVCYCCQFGSFF